MRRNETTFMKRRSAAILHLGEGIEAGETEKQRKRAKGVLLKRGFDRMKVLEELRGGKKLSRSESIPLPQKTDIDAAHPERQRILASKKPIEAEIKTARKTSSEIGTRTATPSL